MDQEDHFGKGSPWTKEHKHFYPDGPMLMHKCTKRYCRICFYPNWGLATKPYPFNTRIYDSNKGCCYIMVYCGPGAIYPYALKER